MRKLIVCNIVSLDGYYEGPGKDVMALPFDEAFDGYNVERLRAADTLLLGRTSFDGFKSFWPAVADDRDARPVVREISRRNNAIEKVVVSDSLTADETAPWHGAAIVKRADAHDRIAELKQRPGKVPGTAFWRISIINNGPANKLGPQVTLAACRDCDIEGAMMGQARDVLDRLTAAVIEEHSAESVAKLYADQAVVITPDAGEVIGRQQIADYWRQFIDGFPDGNYESISQIEAGNKAVDEGYFMGTHTAPMKTWAGETVPPTGKQVKVRECDIVTVQNGKITEHHIYFDELEFFRQLGLEE